MNRAALEAHEGLTGDPSRIRIATGIFDDPFIFPTFFGTNIVGMVLSIPLDAFPPDQENWVLWATSTENGKQVDHVGRSLRTQNPRFDMLNTLPPNQHVKAIAEERLHPSLMRDLALRINLQGTFAFRDWDEVPDVMLYSKRTPVGFPNGRLLTDDVAERLATYGDTLLKEISYITGKWPRATKNDMPFRLTAAAACRGAAEAADPKCDQSVPENLAPPASPRSVAGEEGSRALRADRSELEVEVSGGLHRRHCHPAGPRELARRALASPQESTGAFPVSGHVI